MPKKGLQKKHKNAKPNKDKKIQFFEKIKK
jgi:hypothetical protein